MKGIAKLAIDAGTKIDILNSKKSPIEPLDYVVGGMEAETVGVLVAPGGYGKTMLVLNICLSVSTGIDLTKGALPAKHTGKVLYINLEDSPKALTNRIKSITKEYLTDEQVEELAENCDIVSLKGLSLKLLDSKGQPVDEHIDWLLERTKGYRLVVIDTLKRLHSANESDASHMSDLLGVLEGVCVQNGCSILLVHHANKSATMNGQGGEAGASRGSSVITDNARYQLNLSGLSEKRAKEVGIDPELRRKFVVMTESKVNNKADMDGVILMRDGNGILVRPVLTLEHMKVIPKTGGAKKSKQEAHDEY